MATKTTPKGRRGARKKKPGRRKIGDAARPRTRRRRRVRVKPIEGPLQLPLPLQMALALGVEAFDERVKRAPSDLEHDMDARGAGLAQDEHASTRPAGGQRGFWD